MAAVSLERLADTVEGLIDAARLLKRDAPAREALEAIIARGKFRPDEDEATGYWFARYLSIRESLRPVIDDVIDVLGGTRSSDDEELRYFLVGYAAVCVLVDIDRVMLFDVARHSIIQRKLNEPRQELRIPRKQFTRVFEAFVDEKGALSLLDAMNFAKKNRRQLEALADDGRQVHGAGEVVDHGVEQRLDALVLEGAAAEDRADQMLVRRAANGRSSG